MESRCGIEIFSRVLVLRTSPVLLGAAFEHA